MNYLKMLMLTTTMMVAGGVAAKPVYEEQRHAGASSPIYQRTPANRAPVDAQPMQLEEAPMAQTASDERLGAEVFGRDGRMLGRVTEIHRAPESDDVIAYEVSSLRDRDVLAESLRVEADQLEFSENDGIWSAHIVGPRHEDLAALPANQGPRLDSTNLVRNEATAAPTNGADFRRTHPAEDTAVAQSSDSREWTGIVAADRRVNEARIQQARRNGTGAYRSQTLARNEVAEANVMATPVANLKAQVRERLPSAAQRDLRRVSIVVESDSIVLDGRVSSEENRVAIEDAAREATAMNVRSELEVTN